MLVKDAISQAKAMTGTVVDDAALCRWLSELDGRLAFEFYKADAWLPYTVEDDKNCELLVPFPWDGLYIHHLEAMTYYTNGEYDRYKNAMAMSEKVLALEQGKVKDGDVAVMIAAGIGYTWAANVIQWG